MSELRLVSPSNMKLRSPLDHFISEKSPRVEFSLQGEEGAEERRERKDKERWSLRGYREELERWVCERMYTMKGIKN